MTELLTAFGVVFLAELGDKTQIAAAGFGARHRLAPVLLGVTLGYAFVNIVSVVIGGVLGASLPTRAISIGGGVLFLLFALWNLRPEADEEVDVDGASTPGHRNIVASIALTMFVAELGDKTMIATATLAAKESPVLVWFGATGGIVAAGVIGVLIGRAAGARLPERAVRIASTCVFFGVGAVLLWSGIRG